MSVPVYSLPVTGTAPNQTVSDAAHVAAVNAVVASLYATSVGFGARLGAETMTATKAGLVWTVSATGIFGQVGDQNIDVANITGLSVGVTQAIVVALADANPRTASVVELNSTVRGQIEAGTHLLILGNRDGALFGALQDRAAAAFGIASVTPEAIGLGDVDNTADNAKPLSAAQVLMLDRPVRSPDYIGGIVDEDGAPALLIDRRGKVHVSDLVLHRAQAGRWVAGIKDEAGRVALGISADGTAFLWPSAELAQAMEVARLSRDEPPLSAAHVISTTSATIGGRTVSLVVAERGGVTRLHAKRTDIASDTMMVHSAAPIRYIAASGQSNSIGGGGAVPKSLLPPMSAQALMWNSGARGSMGSTLLSSRIVDFVPLAEVLEDDRGETQGTGACAWLHRTRAMDGLPPDVTVFRSHGQGATTIANLSQGSVPYANGLAEITPAVTVAAAYGRTLRCNAIFWDQGEADRNSLTVAQYQTALQDLIADYNTDWGAVLPVGNGSIHMFVTQLSASTQNPAGNASLAHLSAARADPLIHISTPNYIFDFVDTVHKTGLGHFLAGEYQMRAHDVVARGGAWTPLWPTSVTRSGAVITIVFSVPEGDLEFSDDLRPFAENMGFEYTDDSASQTIAAVAITAPNTVQVTLTGTPSGANPAIAYAFAGGEDTSGRAKAWGNLVSRSADVSFSGLARNLDHYCVTFKENI